MAAAAPLLLALLVGAAPPPVLQPLFELGRSKNANVVVYSARVDPDGDLDPNQPLDAHWILKAQGGGTEALNELERKLAYGFSVKPAGPGEWTVTLNAFKARPFTLLKLSDGWRAVLRIGGQPSELTRIFVHEKDELDVPEVRSAELWGQTVGGSSKTHEVLRPGRRRRRRRHEDSLF